jgi:hypothetical protein
MLVDEQQAVELARRQLGDASRAVILDVVRIE